MSKTDGKRPLPPGWRWAKLGEVCEVVTGATPSRTVAEFFGGDVPWVKPEDLDKDIYVAATKEYLTPYGASQARILPVGSVLVSCIGNLGKVGISACRLATNQQINALVPSAGVTSDYLYFYCKTLRPYLEALAGQTTLTIVKKSAFASLPVLLPTLDEQRRIAARLSEQMAHVDKMREAAHAQVKAARALPSSLLRRIFESAEAQSWPKVRLSDACQKPQYGYTASSTSEAVGPKLLRITDIQDGRVDWAAVPFCRCSSGDAEKFALRAGDLLFARSGGTTGKSLLVEDVPTRTVFASYLIRLRVGAQLLPMFAYLFFQSDLYWRQVGLGMRGGAQPNMNATLLAEVVLPLPPVALQRKLASQLDRDFKVADEAERAAQAQLDAANALTNSLLEQVFGGFEPPA